MRGVLISCSFFWLCCVGQEAAAAGQCADIYPGARIGPPPEWTFWADGSACFVRWPITNAGDENKLLARCRGTPGSRFVHFERSKSAAQSICIFKVLDVANPTDSALSPQAAPASGDEEKALDATDSEVPTGDDNEPKPGETRDQGPDPNRLAATLGCSSIKLGNYKHCIDAPHSVGAEQFTFSLKNNCREGAIAAIAITDANGKCIRRVTPIPASGRSVAIESAGVPSILDAIRFEADVFECYARRHDNISCDGNTDYSDPRPHSQIVINLAAVERPAVREPAKKATRAQKKRSARKKTRSKKVVATRNVLKTSKQQRTRAKKWKPEEKRSPACVTTIWQCSNS